MKHSYKIIQNTDTVDIMTKCLGLSTTVDHALSDLNNDRGLKIQIKHNHDKATFAAANELSRLIIAAPDLLYALLKLKTQIEDQGLQDRFCLGLSQADYALDKLKGK